jgi:hypothetical protein
MIHERRQLVSGHRELLFVLKALLDVAAIREGVAGAGAKASPLSIRLAQDAPERLQAGSVLLYQKLVPYRGARQSVFELLETS